MAHNPLHRPGYSKSPAYQGRHRYKKRNRNHLPDIQHDRRHTRDHFAPQQKSLADRNYASRQRRDNGRRPLHEPLRPCPQKHLRNHQCRNHCAQTNLKIPNTSHRIASGQSRKSRRSHPRRYKITFSLNRPGPKAGLPVRCDLGHGLIVECF